MTLTPTFRQLRLFLESWMSWFCVFFFFFLPRDRLLTFRFRHENLADKGEVPPRLKGHRPLIEAAVSCRPRARINIVKKFFESLLFVFFPFSNHERRYPRRRRPAVSEAAGAVVRLRLSAAGRTRVPPLTAFPRQESEKGQKESPSWVPPSPECLLFLSSPPPMSRLTRFEGRKVCAQFFWTFFQDCASQLVGFPSRAIGFPPSGLPDETYSPDVELVRSGIG